MNIDDLYNTLLNPCSDLYKKYAKKENIEMSGKKLDKWIDNMNTNNNIDIVFSFDTTGSMYPCLAQVRLEVRNLINKIYNEIPGLRIGIISHGDYCDGNYAIQVCDLSRDIDKVCDFIEKAPRTSGGDAPECYELVLHRARILNWNKEAGHKILVLIGDDIPHNPDYTNKKLNWEHEAKELSKLNITIHSVQCLNKTYATNFYKTLSELGNGKYLRLNQFYTISDLFLSLVYSTNPTKLSTFEKELQKFGRLNRDLSENIDKLLNRHTIEKHSTKLPTPDKHSILGKFQILNVPSDCNIRDFVNNQGARFRTGKGFYQFTKMETIQPYKEVIVVDKETGDVFEKSYARKLAEIPEKEEIRMKPHNKEKYLTFIQSTSVNRKLEAGTKFLYEMEKSN